MGLGDVIARSSPIAVLGGFIFQTIHGNYSSVIAEPVFGLTPGGTLYAWGINTNGGLGVGDVIPRSSPVAVLGGFTFRQVFPAQYPYVYALDGSGNAYGWGLNDNGQLGVGDVTPRSSPVAVLGGFTFTRLSVCNKSVFGLTSAGAAYAWGLNGSGQLGLGDVVPRSSPIAVLGGFTFAKLFTNIASATGSAYGLTAAGALYAWGFNDKGQLGVGDIIPRSSPVAVLGGLTFVDVFPGASNNIFAITADGTLYSWGANANGQLGLGDVVARSSPVAVLGGLKFVNVSVQSVWNIGLATNGSLYGWGLDISGALGVGDITPRSSPVAVLGRLTVNCVPVIGSVIVPVTPGVTYTVTMQQNQAFFGRFAVGQENVDELTVEYVS